MGHKKVPKTCQSTDAKKLHGEGTYLNRYIDRHFDYYTESAQWADSVKSEMALLYRRSQSSLLSGKIEGSQTHVPSNFMLQ